MVPMVLLPWSHPHHHILHPQMRMADDLDKMGNNYIPEGQGLVVLRWEEDGHSVDRIHHTMRSQQDRKRVGDEKFLPTEDHY